MLTGFLFWQLLLWQWWDFTQCAYILLTNCPRSLATCGTHSVHSMKFSHNTYHIVMRLFILSGRCSGNIHNAALLLQLAVTPKYLQHLDEEEQWSWGALPNNTLEKSWVVEGVSILTTVIRTSTSKPLSLCYLHSTITCVLSRLDWPIITVLNTPIGTSMELVQDPRIKIQITWWKTKESKIHVFQGKIYIFHISSIYTSESQYPVPVKSGNWKHFSRLVYVENIQILYDRTYGEGTWDSGIKRWCAVDFFPWKPRVFNYLL